MSSTIRLQGHEVLRNLTVVVIVALTISVSAVVVVGAKLVAPGMHNVGAPPDMLSAQTIQIPRPDAEPIAGWFVVGKPEVGGMLLLHSVRSNRREMVERAQFINSAGYSVLLIDMQGHGETPGTHITFGYRESRDVRDAIRYLRERAPESPIGILGVSLGGAAALLGEEPLDVDALILEAVYSNIEKATANRLEIRLGKFGRYLAPLLLWQIEPRLGISLQSMSPVTAIGRLDVPVLIVAGENDRRTTLSDSRELFAHAPEPKSLWVVPGARHENFHRFSAAEYERKILAFLQTYMHYSAT